MYLSIKALRSEFMILIGDNVYYDSGPPIAYIPAVACFPFRLHEKRKSGSSVSGAATSEEQHYMNGRCAAKESQGGIYAADASDICIKVQILYNSDNNMLDKLSLFH